MDRKIVDELKATDNIPEMIKILGKSYDLENFKMPPLAKNIFIANLESIINFLKVPTKNG